ncbi:hypothetical protein [Krasilnikovia sp. MM14-A1259]|uniref:hypothetical protein n=1 Tax=Krasilnikovia sp. MM14-A1259 TaxID=3373539 RepID=UPI003825A940
MPSRVYFSDYFRVSEDDLDAHGALNICLVSDLPMFIDPFLLFQSKKPEYQLLHKSIISYLVFLRSRAELATRNEGLLKEWFYFGEVKQNWLGFCFLGNQGRGPGMKFAESLIRNLNVFVGGQESVHLEHIRLVDDGVGQDGVSDFATNLIKRYLLEYTQDFARQYVAPDFRRRFVVERVDFDYGTETWVSGTFELPFLDPQKAGISVRKGKRRADAGDYVLLTPTDLLSRNDTFINREDLLRNFDKVVKSCENENLRAKINEYFKKMLMEIEGENPRYEAIVQTLWRFPDLNELYLKLKEREAQTAGRQNRDDVDYIQTVFISRVRRIIDELEQVTDFYSYSPDSHDEALKRVLAFKRYVEDQDEYRVINRRGKPFSDEAEVQLFFGLIWYGTTFDVNREPNNGRGPVDFKVSYGRDKALVELKLASNTKLEMNLKNQVRIYEKANQTQKSIKVIIFYTEQQEHRACEILKNLKLDKDPSIVMIDARNDNKPSASNVR